MGLLLLLLSAAGADFSADAAAAAVWAVGHC
jgi:hypothetical protein